MMTSTNDGNYSTKCSPCILCPLFFDCLISKLNTREFIKYVSFQWFKKNINHIYSLHTIQNQAWYCSYMCIWYTCITFVKVHKEYISYNCRYSRFLLTVIWIALIMRSILMFVSISYLLQLLPKGPENLNIMNWSI